MLWAWLLLCARLAAGARAPAAGDFSTETMRQTVEMGLGRGQGLAGRDPMLSALQGAGRARAALCAEGAACAGALWGRRWLLARASCVADLPLAEAAVLPYHPLASCWNITPDAGPIKVLARFVHPQHEPGTAAREHDAALLLLAGAAPVPPHDNHTRALQHVPGLQPWLQYIPAQYPSSWDRPPAPARGLRLEQLRLASSPLRLLASAVLLPAAALLLLFALALRLPGGPGGTIRYDLLAQETLEKAEQAGDMKDETEEKDDELMDTPDRAVLF